MTKILRLIAAAFAISAVVPVPAQAYMTGIPGEALLVPFALFGDGNSVDDQFDTVVKIVAPSTINRDTIPNDYTAPNTTAGGLYTFPGARQTVHWYFFDQDRTLRTNGSFTVEADIPEEFRWSSEATMKGLGTTLANVPGYLIFNTAAARNGSAANFAMVGYAYFALGEFRNPPPPVAPTTLRDSHLVTIPVLPMSDGADVVAVGPRIGNEVVYAGNVPSQASPLIAGMRISIPDGDRFDTVFFDLPFEAGNFVFLGNFSTLAAIWLDDDYGFTNVDVTLQGESTSCTDTVDLDRGLNLLYFFRDSGGSIRVNASPFTYGASPGSLPTLCTAGGFLFGSRGYLRVDLPEGNDAGAGTGATSAGVAFSLVISDVAEGSGVPVQADAVMQLGQDKGKFSPFIIGP